MRLRALVREVTGNARHYYGTILDDRVVPASPVPIPHYVEIADDGGGSFLLLYFDEEGNELTDTWHETVDDAKRQAEFEFCIGDNDWQDVR